jgi:uncharacterized pyridoxal phosphate-containing UPF0001 family protein
VTGRRRPSRLVDKFVTPFTPENPILLNTGQPYFRMLGELHSQIPARKLPNVHLNVLSWDAARLDVPIEEGSTCVRVGTLIFRKRTGR